MKVGELKEKIKDCPDDADFAFNTMAQDILCDWFLKGFGVCMGGVVAISTYFAIWKWIEKIALWLGF